MKEVKLESGSVLKIGLVPFEDAKALYQIILNEATAIRFSSQAEVGNVIKDFFCIGFASKRVETALWECFKRVQYCDKRGELKIDKDTFEPIEARADYIEVCTAVTTEVLSPFSKGLYAAFKTLFEKADTFL